LLLALCHCPTHGSATGRRWFGSRLLGLWVHIGCDALGSPDPIAALHSVLVISHDASEQRSDRLQAGVRMKTDQDIACERAGRDLVDFGMLDKLCLEETFQRY
jgi:hypothetical protein